MVPASFINEDLGQQPAPLRQPQSPGCGSNIRFRSHRLFLNSFWMDTIDDAARDVPSHLFFLGSYASFLAGAASSACRRSAKHGQRERD